jgi:hypothetical protein
MSVKIHRKAGLAEMLLEHCQLQTGTRFERSIPTAPHKGSVGNAVQLMDPQRQEREEILETVEVRLEWAEISHWKGLGLG